MDGPELTSSTRRASAARLRLGEAEPVEAICPSGRRLGLDPQAGRGPGQRHDRGRRAELGGRRRWRRRRVGRLPPAPHQLALVGRCRPAPTAQAVAWNLVEGINDPPRAQRAGDLGGRRRRASRAPVELRAASTRIAFAGGARLRFDAESERARSDNLLVFRSRYRHRFGTFSGSLDGIELGEGFGVMEEHEVVW